MMIENIYPWHHEVWQRLTQDTKRLPHALLLQGRIGTGKLNFALQLTKCLLCHKPQSHYQACNACSSCHWFEQNNHPDYRLLTPEQESESLDDSTIKKTSKKTQISVSQVRELANFLELSSHRNNGLRIVLIHPAETLNIASANALLKMLEEPPQGMVFILVTNQPQRLLPTIISRCQKIDMPTPDEANGLLWLNNQGLKNAKSLLAYSGGSPLSALNQTELEMMTDAIRELARGRTSDCFIATSILISQGMVSALNILQKWCYDLLACKVASGIRYHIEHASTLQLLVKSVDLALLLEFQRKLDDAKKSATHPLNHELQLEHLLLQYKHIFRVNS